LQALLAQQMAPWPPQLTQLPPFDTVPAGHTHELPEHCWPAGQLHTQAPLLQTWLAGLAPQVPPLFGLAGQLPSQATVPPLQSPVEHAEPWLATQGTSQRLPFQV
jgi:hypothetical protein